MCMTTLKDKLKKEAEEKLENSKRKIERLRKSNLPGKDEKIIQCEQEIKKQERILKNINSYK